MVSTELARNLVRQFIANGIKDVVLSPGSRNAPLSIALNEAAERGFVDLHIRIDERTAGFFALGIAKASRNRTAVVCTSGTAAANYYPAFLESFHSQIPLLVVTADRPVRVRETGANQTTKQSHLFNCGTFAEAVEPDFDLTNLFEDNGPIHLNVQFDEPLLSKDQSDWLANINKISQKPINQSVEEFQVPNGKGLLVIGHDRAGLRVSEVCDFAAMLGAPTITEDPISFEFAIPHASLFSNRLEVDWVFVIGRTTLSRSTNTLINSAKEVYVLDPRQPIVDPKRTATKIFKTFPNLIGKAETWLENYSTIASELIKNHKEWSEPGLAHFIGKKLPTGTSLFVSSSRPIRDIEAFADSRDGIETFANRGLAGIDGNISTALGIASKRQSTFALIGDLSFLHDLTALVNQEDINLKLIVINNDGGGIFSTLPQAGTPGFEKIFGTPHGKDLLAIAKSFGISSIEVNSYSELENFLKKSAGFEIAICQMPSRESNAALIKSLTPA